MQMMPVTPPDKRKAARTGGLVGRAGFKCIAPKYIDDVLEKITHLVRHIRNVEDNCVLLGTKLIERGDTDMGRQLIANGMVHDASKFYGIEFENLSSVESCKEETSKLKLKMAVHHHRKTNLHHPEAWTGGILGMPDVYLAEFCCDSKARSEEFGTDLREWISESATKRYGFVKDDKVYKQIMEYVNLLCQTPFTNTGQT